MTDMKVPAAFYFTYRPQMQSEAEEAMTSRPSTLPTGASYWGFDHTVQTVIHTWTHYS